MRNEPEGFVDFCIDDSKWQIALRQEEPRKGGLVRVELEAA